MGMNREADAARPDRTVARVARRIALAEQELQTGDPALTVSALELIGSAVADWALNSSRSRGLLTGAHQTPATVESIARLWLAGRRTPPCAANGVPGPQSRASRTDRARPASVAPVAGCSQVAVHNFQVGRR